MHWKTLQCCMPIPPRRNGGFCLRRLQYKPMPPGKTGILQMDADAPRPNGDFAKMNAWQANFVSQTQALRTNEAVPATDRNVALRNQLLKLEREKKKRPLSQGPKRRRGAQSPRAVQADNCPSRSCLGFHCGCELVDLRWLLHCVQLGFLICLAFHCALPFWWIYNFAFSWIDVVSGFWCYVL